MSNTDDISNFHATYYETEEQAIEPIKYISSNKLCFCRGSIVKYAHRAGDKPGQEVLDIRKIIDYAMLLAFQEGIPVTREELHKLIDYRFDWNQK